MSMSGAGPPPTIRPTYTPNRSRHPNTRRPLSTDPARDLRVFLGQLDFRRRPAVFGIQLVDRAIDGLCHPQIAVVPPEPCVRIPGPGMLRITAPGSSNDASVFPVLVVPTHFENFVGIHLVENPKPVGGGLQIIGLFARRLKCFFHALGNDR